jgi:hypothetical protein
VVGNAHELFGKSTPAKTWLRAQNQDDVATGASNMPDTYSWPHDAANTAIFQANVRANGCKVGECLWVDLGKLRTALDAASAASFQPVKAVTITGCFREGLDNQRT